MRDSIPGSFYRLVSAEILENSTAAYKALSHYTAEARRAKTFSALMDRKRRVFDTRRFRTCRTRSGGSSRSTVAIARKGETRAVYLGVEKGRHRKALNPWGASAP